MLGNDIIDLKTAAKESNWRRKGYLKKICTAEEQKMIKNAPDPDTLLWTYWAMKEAAYKVFYRETKIREYAPARIACSLLKMNRNCTPGIVRYHDFRYFTETYRGEHYLHCLASKSESKIKQMKRIEIKEYPEDYVFYLKENAWMAPQEFIEKDDFDLPWLVDETIGETIPVSISHHGIYFGMVFIR